MSRWGLEALAHHAESLLADVRSERQGFPPAIRDLLIESLDGIRLLREHGIVSGLDEPAPQALLHALEAALNPGENGENLHASAPEVPEGALHPDAETLRHFAEMLADCLPGLAVLAGASGLRDQAVSDLDMLLVATEKVAFHGLEARLRALAPTVDTANLEPFTAVIAPAQLCDLSHDALTPFTEMLAGGDRQIIAVTVALPAASERGAFLTWLAQRTAAPSARALSQSGVDAAALLLVSRENPAPLQAAILTAHPELAFVEARALVDDKVETPWSPPRAANTLKTNDPARNRNLAAPAE